MPISFRTRDFSPRRATLIAASLLCLMAGPAPAAEDEAAPKGAAVTVLKAAKACFANIVEVSGTIIPREENQALYKQYEALADATPNVTFVGRLATYRYYNMDQIVGQALATFRRMDAARRDGSMGKEAEPLAVAAE